LEETTNHLINT